MFGISLGELFLIVIVAILMLEPRDLPKIAANLAKLVNYLKSTLNQLKAELSEHEISLLSTKNAVAAKNTLKNYDFSIVDQQNGKYQPELDFEAKLNLDEQNISTKSSPADKSEN